MNPQFIVAGVLGLVQGLTEFIPVSSSGHLIIVRELLGWTDQGDFFDAVLHLATLAAVVVYFWRDWVAMANSLFDRAAGRAKQPDRKLFWLVVVATLPAITLGLFLEPWIGTNFRGLLPVAILMIVSGIAWWSAERRISAKQDLAKLNPARAFGIGWAQALAMLPGISRSGATIVAGMYMELKREAAAKFSFLLAAPVVALAGGYALYESIRAGALNWSDYQFWLVAFTASLIAGLAAIRFLMSFLKKYPLDIFAYYLMIAGVSLLVWHFWK